MIFQFFSIKRHKKEKKKSGSYLLSRRSSIIGVRELDFRVRYGNGYCLSTMATGIIIRICSPSGTFMQEGLSGRNSKGKIIWSSLTDY